MELPAFLRRSKPVEVSSDAMPVDTNEALATEAQGVIKALPPPPPPEVADPLLEIGVGCLLSEALADPNSLV